jgi:hypothetical protein
MLQTLAAGETGRFTGPGGVCTGARTRSGRVCISAIFGTYFEVSGLRFRVSGFRVQALGLRVQASGFGV